MTRSIKFANNGDSIVVLTYDDEQIFDKLPVDFYSVSFSPLSGFSLTKKIGGLSAPATVYGQVSKRVDKVMRSYQEADSSFGVLLSGDKGAGKTMTSALIAARCMKELNIPVVMVEKPFDSSGLATFIESLGECVVFIDEFGKKFDDDENEQNGLLSMLDGSSTGKRLVLLTENNIEDINNFMLNRPGRVYYHFRHGKLDEKVIVDYCRKFGIEETTINQICLRREQSYEFSFDSLQTIVREYSVFGGNINEICDDLNIEAPSKYGPRYAFKISQFVFADDNTPVPVFKGDLDRLFGFPTHSHLAVPVIDRDDPEDREFITFSIKDIVKKDGDSFVFNGNHYNRRVLLVGDRVELPSNYNKEAF